MDALTLVNTGLAGFFACAAIHYATLWWFSRKERVLLVFSIQCLMYTAFCVAITLFFRARTIRDSQVALDRFVTIGVCIHAVVLHFYSYLSHRGDRAFRALVTATLVFLAILNQWAPLRGRVMELRQVQLPGGLSTLVPIRTPPGASLAVLYVAVLAVEAYGVVVSRAIWRRDRAGSVLIALGSAAILAGAALGFLVDFAHVRVPYAGAWPHAIFILCMTLFLSREYATRGARAAASERRLERALRETQEALASLQTEQRRREETEIARQKALEALVLAQRTDLASQLAAGVAHDFNNVLGVMSMWTSVLLSESRPAAADETARKAIADARQEGAALSRQLAALARPDARSASRFPLDRPIQSAVQLLTPTLPRALTLHLEAQARPEVEADEAEIRQVVYNLVLNARDAMPRGGSIHVSAGLETSPIPLTVVGGSLAPGCWATLTVTDSGTGIDPAIRDRIFDPFFTTKGKERGMGLGLAAVLRIAKASGGGVVLQDEDAPGATFKVYLPAAEQSTTCQANSPSEVDDRPGTHDHDR